MSEESMTREQLVGALRVARLELDDQRRDLVRRDRIIDQLPVGIAFLDKDLVCRWANQAFSRIVELPIGQVLGRAFHEAFPDAEPAVAARLREVVAAKDARAPRVLPFLSSRPGLDGTSIWDLLALPLVGDDATVQGVIVAIDVTARVARERSQRERIAQLTELEHLQGDFVSMVSHELRTPLTAIAGFAEFLEDGLGGPLSDAQRSYVAAIQEAEARIHGIVDDLLDIARLEAGTFVMAPEDVDLGELAAQAAMLLEPQATARRVRLKVERPDEPVTVLADPKRIGQVLMNLVANALKFTPAGGEVRVEVARRGGCGGARVSDTGIGIGADEQRRVFDKFFQAQAPTPMLAGGAGLGLAISKMLVERSGGRIGVESQASVGSTFWFALPLAAPADVDPPADPPA